jgi:hypothetical protein
MAVCGSTAASMPAAASASTLTPLAATGAVASRLVVALFVTLPGVWTGRVPGWVAGGIIGRMGSATAPGAVWTPGAVVAGVWVVAGVVAVVGADLGVVRVTAPGAVVGWVDVEVDELVALDGDVVEGVGGVPWPNAATASAAAIAVPVRKDLSVLMPQLYAHPRLAPSGFFRNEAWGDGS